VPLMHTYPCSGGADTYKKNDVLSIQVSTLGLEQHCCGAMRATTVHMLMVHRG
jgi:hypothetical protein